ncbi:MAG TPA: phosphate acyltransferase [bacterium]|jgi:phosphate acetyltransferase
MILQELLDRAAGRKPGRITAVGASDFERSVLAEWQQRGWTVNHCSGDLPDCIYHAVDSAVKGETDMIFCSGDEGLKLTRMLDRAVPREFKPLSVLQGFEVPTYHKMLWAGFTPLGNYDSIPEAIKGVQTMVRALSDLGEPESKVALLSCVELISASVHSTIWEATLGHMSQRGQFGKAKVDGPLAFDLAVSPRAVDEKGLKSEIGGQADLVIPPDLNSFETLVDAIHLSGQHRAVGVIVGGPCPIALPPHRSERHLDLSLKIASLLT